MTLAARTPPFALGRQGGQKRRQGRAHNYTAARTAGREATVFRRRLAHTRIPVLLVLVGVVLQAALAIGTSSLSTRKGGGGSSQGKTGAAGGAKGGAINAVHDSGVRNKGGIWTPEKKALDPGPPCCQICTEKVYHSIALLQLPEPIERAAVDRFHAYRNWHQTTMQRERNQRKTAMRFRERHASTRKSTISSGRKRFIGSTNNGAIAGTPQANAFGGYDILEALQNKVETAKQKLPDAEAMQSTPPTQPNPDRMGGAMGAGPCCRVCPYWFIPTNQKYYAQGDIQPEYGKAFLEISSSMDTPTIFGGSSRGAVGRGQSECCNVCTDNFFPPSRDINEVNDITFMEVKAKLKQGMGSEDSSQVSSELQRNSRGKSSLSSGCCTLCPEKASGGWSGEEPFSDPTSLDQYLEQQSEDPTLMRQISDKRTWSHSSTTSNHFLLAAKTIDRLSSKFGGAGGGLSSILRL